MASRSAGSKDVPLGSEPVVFTIGHSTRTFEELVDLLEAHAVTLLIDVRSVPRSRRNPQFNRETLPAALEKVGIGYTHVAALGGFRRPSADSPNQAWRNTSFRGYADYMQTDEFQAQLATLVERAATERIALMCAEAVPWRCHRTLIADALLARGVRVDEIISTSRTQRHSLTSFAQVSGASVTYPAEPGTSSAERRPQK